jgi:hypothetical protein
VQTPALVVVLVAALVVVLVVAAGAGIDADGGRRIEGAAKAKNGVM